MGPMSNWLYFALTIPLYLVWITALSVLFFIKLKLAIFFSGQFWVVCYHCYSQQLVKYFLASHLRFI